MKRNTASLAARLIPAAICATPLLASAGQTVAEPIITAPAASPWEFRITPYAWLTAIDGTSGPDGFTTELDASFSDIADVLKMAAALQIEARYERWGFLADGFYANLGASGHTSGPLQANVDVDFKTRGYTADHFCTVGNGLLGVKGPLRTGETLANHFGTFVDKNAHFAIPPAALTACCAASVRLVAAMIFKPLAART